MSKLLDTFFDYSEGKITADELVDKVVAFQMKPMDGPTDGFDTTLACVPDSFDDVMLADDLGLIDDEIYARIWNGRNSR